MKKYILSIDQGTTSSRVVIFDKQGEIVSFLSREFKQYFPKAGYVLHDASEIWESVLYCMNGALEKAGITLNDIDSIGITNQRETTVMWDSVSHEPVCKAIVWQSSQTKAICDALEAKGYNDIFKEKTGLLINPYFSGTKIKWIMDNCDLAKEAALKGNLRFGTIDTWLIWKLTNGKSHITDYSNASRTLIYNIFDLQWDDELLEILNIPKSVLPIVKPSSAINAYTDKSTFGVEIPIAGIAGDQQAALFGQTCFTAGDVKNTYGTGCFILMNTGETPKISKHGLLTTIAWGIDGKITYALEGSIFVAGSAVQWLRDGLEIIKDASETEALAYSVDSNLGVYFVPAFAGLGTPFWEEDVRGCFFGLTRGVTKAHMCRSALEAIAYQTKDVINVMQDESKIKLKTLKVDGGASQNNFLMQFQADILNTTIYRPFITETTALGAAYLAGLATGFWELEEIQNKWKIDTEYTTNMSHNDRKTLYNDWKKALRASIKFAK
ncbi:MAG: glycerol kinase GlpK [Tenericutes bacterium]|nr:glycerol kinase GlpK [Mycoplasmatota bacterium]